MKYYIIHLLTRCGEFEFTQPMTIMVEPDASAAGTANDLRDNWYGEDNLELVDTDDWAWFTNGNSVEVSRITEIPEQDFLILEKYI